MIINEEDYLEHFGVKGMKWGVRRYQNPDGTLTAKGKKRRESELAYNKDVYDSGRRNYENKENHKYINKNASYKINKDGSMIIDKGYVMNRIVDRKASDGSYGMNFFSFTEGDKASYTAMMAGGAHSRFKFIRKLASGYLSQQVATESLKSPSTKEAYDILKETYSDKKPKVKIPPYEKGGRDWYLEFNAGLGNRKANDDEIVSNFIDRVQNRGYNMLADDNDGPNGLGLAEAPVIILNGQKSLKPLSLKDISQDQIDTAKKFSKDYGSKSLDEMIKYMNS